MQQSLSESTLFYTNGKAWELYTVTQVVDFYNIHKNPLQQENTTYEAFTFTQLSKLWALSDITTLTAQCGNFRIFLPLRFFVKLKSNFRAHKLSKQQFVRLWIFDFMISRKSWVQENFLDFHTVLLLPNGVKRSKISFFLGHSVSNSQYKSAIKMHLKFVKSIF